MEVRRISDALKVRAHAPSRMTSRTTTRGGKSPSPNGTAKPMKWAAGWRRRGWFPATGYFLPISNNACDRDGDRGVRGVPRRRHRLPDQHAPQPRKEIADYAALCEPRFCLTDAPDLMKDVAACRLLDASMPCRAISRRCPTRSSARSSAADAEILGTSGTTGKIKGVVDIAPRSDDRRHRDQHGPLALDAERAAAHRDPAAIIGIVMLPARGGATAITQQKFDPKGFLELGEAKSGRILSTWCRRCCGSCSIIPMSPITTWRESNI